MGEVENGLVNSVEKATEPSGQGFSGKEIRELTEDYAMTKAIQYLKNRALIV